MRVPLIFADRPRNITEVGNTGAGAYARADAGNMAVDAAADVARQEAILRKRAQMAQDQLTAIELNNQMAAEFAANQESFISRTDSQNFDQDASAMIKQAKDKFMPKNASPELTEAFARAFGSHSQNFYNNVTAMKYKVMEANGRIEIDRLKDNAAKEYISTTDPYKKQAIKTNYELSVRGAINSNLVDRVWGENAIRNFDTYMAQKETDAAEGEAISRMAVDPAQLAKDLDRKDYLPGLTDQSRRATLKREALTAAKVMENDKRTKQKQFEEDMRNNEQRGIDDAFLSGDYTKAFQLTQASKYIDSRIDLGKKIQSAAEAQAEGKPINPTLEAITLAGINGMMTRNEDPAKIKDAIVYSKNLSGETKKTAVNKLEADLNQEIKDGRARGYQSIVKVIFPGAFDLLGTNPEAITPDTLDRILNSAKISPEQVIGITKTQIALDNWIQEELKVGRYPSSPQIRMKALELVGTYQMTVGEKVEFWRQQLNK